MQSHDYTLVAVDVSGIQDYVFRTNNLQHHLGASELVQRATNTWVRECLPSPNNMPQDDTLEDQRIEQGVVDAEVLYSGGGNVVILFAAEHQATRFIQALTRKALLEAPGLNVTVASCPFVWRDENASDLGAKLGELLGGILRRKKQSGRANGELLGLSVTADCEFTGLPAIRRGGKENQRISAEIAAKLAAAPLADERLKHEIGGDDYVRDFNEFGEKNKFSYMAVIHADGNRMGKRFERLARLGLPNRDYILAVRALSESVNRAAKEALKVIAAAIRNMQLHEDFSPFKNGKLLFRPIIFGGDDVTFVCDGRLGLTVAARYLEEFAKQKLKEHDRETTPTARAGVAIVKTHFPFGQAYRIAEELSQSAKRFSDEGKYSTMDWHFGVNGILGDLKFMRERNYVAREGQTEHSLLMRPVRLGEPSGEWRTWVQFAQIVNALQGNYPNSKIKALRDALRSGPSAAKRFIAANWLDKPLPTVPDHTSDTGWIGEHCVYFDAIEAMDFFMPLEPAKTKDGGGKLRQRCSASRVVAVGWLAHSWSAMRGYRRRCTRPLNAQWMRG